MSVQLLIPMPSDLNPVSAFPAELKNWLFLFSKRALFLLYDLFLYPLSNILVIHINNTELVSR